MIRRIGYVTQSVLVIRSLVKVSRSAMSAIVAHGGDRLAHRVVHGIPVGGVDPPRARVGAEPRHLPTREATRRGHGLCTGGRGVEEAVEGWGGDTYVTWVDGSGKTCLRDSFVGDTPDDTQQLADALNQWASDVNAMVSAPAGQPASFTVCS